MHPNQDLSGTPSMELNFADSSFSAKSPFHRRKANPKNSPVALFDNASFILFPANAKFSVPLQIKGIVPAHVFGSLNYYYGKEDSFYSEIMHSIPHLEGGVNTASRIRINSFDLKHPVSPCGDTGTQEKDCSVFFYWDCWADLSPC